MTYLGPIDRHMRMVMVSRRLAMFMISKTNEGEWVSPTFKTQIFPVNYGLDEIVAIQPTENTLVACRPKPLKANLAATCGV